MSAVSIDSVRLDVEALAGALGAEVRGVDLSRPLDDATLAALRRALLEHLVLTFRDQHLTPQQHKDFAARFGPLSVHDYVPGLPDHPEVIEIVKEPHDAGYNFGGSWHSDLTFAERPAFGSVLYARQVPPHGGDTIFANMYLAFESLSPGMQRLLRGLRAVHSGGRSFGPGGKYDDPRLRNSGSMGIVPDPRASAGVVHPVVRTHPESGRELLFVNENFTVRFEDMTVEESRPLLGFLFAHQQRPEFSCRLRWSENTIAFWDNRATQHFAVNDYHGHHRRMHRVTIEGDRPV